jgi:hypothetical protein
VTDFFELRSLLKFKLLKELLEEVLLLLITFPLLIILFRTSVLDDTLELIIFIFESFESIIFMLINLSAIDLLFKLF